MDDKTRDRLGRYVYEAKVEHDHGIDGLLLGHVTLWEELDERERELDRFTSERMVLSVLATIFGPIAAVEMIRAYTLDEEDGASGSIAPVFTGMMERSYKAHP